MSFSLDGVADGVVGLRIVFVNVFALPDGLGWTLVDAGLYGSAGRILRWTDQHAGRPSTRFDPFCRPHSSTTSVRLTSWRRSGACRCTFAPPSSTTCG
jgi:hypothetical protein